jgi:endonuclease G
MRLRIFLCLIALACGQFLHLSSTAAQSGNEDFESGSKTAYAVGDVQLATGTWRFDNALIGASSSDRKTGAKSVRLTAGGRITQLFDAPSAATVSVRHGLFGTDGAATWRLLRSLDGGQTWGQVGGAVQTASPTLESQSFSVNATGRVRFAVEHAGGGRLNLDDFALSAAATPAPATNVSLTLGNPSAATATNPNNLLSVKQGFAFGYSAQRGTPLWTSWHVEAADLGSVARSNDFRADTSLPSGIYRVQPTDYQGTGFDRGHMCPSGDRTANATLNSETFLMTNMVPQTANNNRVTWEGLESFTRDLVRAGNECYVIAGPAGAAGSIAGGRVTVPTSTWKVVVVLPQGTNDLNRITTATRVITVNVPNIANPNPDWRTYRTSVRSVETLTGLNFLTALPQSLQDVLETRVDAQ